MNAPQLDTAWTELSDALQRSSSRILEETPQLQAEGYRYLARFLAAGLKSCVTHDDPNEPILHSMIDESAPWGLDHPDCHYLYGALQPNANYRLIGDLGTANVLDVQINSGHFSCGSVQGVDTLRAFSRDQLNADPNGAVEYDFTTEENARFLQIRQYFADWNAERPARLILERIDAPTPRATATHESVQAQLRLLTEWIEKGGTLWNALSERFLSMPPNSLHVHEASESRHGALAGQIYAMGHFACQPDEALIIELDAPDCLHWNLSIANRYWETIEYSTRQSSLNHHQAVAHDPKKYLFVVSHQDPGLANWIDPAGTTQGTLAIRCYRAESNPEIRLRLVPSSQLAAELPAGLPSADPNQRQSALQLRRRGVRWRHA